LLIVGNIMAATRKLQPKIDIIFFLFISSRVQNEGLFITIQNVHMYKKYRLTGQ
jgi:hypothetical protein